MRNTYIAGEWNVICDRCGLKMKASALQREWTGLRVCSKCYEVRHPQTLIQVPEEQVTPGWTRPEVNDVFVSVSYPITTEIADYDWLTTEAGVILNTES